MDYNKYFDLPTRELWEIISTKLIFFKMPIYAIYEDFELQIGAVDLPIKNNKIDEDGLQEFRTVGRTTLSLAKLAYAGIPLMMSDRDSMMNLYDLLDAFDYRNEHMISLANTKKINEDDVEAVTFLTMSISDRHTSKINEDLIKSENRIKDIFAPSATTKGKVRQIR